MYHGDIRLGDTIDLKFTTVNTSGVPTTLAGSPVVSAYVGNGTTEITAGITLTVDFDGRTGMHNVRVVATSGNGFATATNVVLAITVGTVGGSSVVGYVVGSFSIEARSAVNPTVGGRTLDVSAAGEAGVDWANVGSPTTSNTLSGTTVGTTTIAGTVNALATNSITAGAVDAGAVTEIQSGLATSATQTTMQADLDDIQTRLPAALTGGRMSASVDAVDNDTSSAGNLRRGVLGNVLGTVGAASTPTSIVTSSLTPAAIVTDQYKGRIVTFDRNTTTTALRGQSTDITGSTSAGVLTVTALTTSPASGDTFTIT